MRSNENGKTFQPLLKIILSISPIIKNSTSTEFYINKIKAPKRTPPINPYLSHIAHIKYRQINKIKEENLSPYTTP